MFRRVGLVALICTATAGSAWSDELDRQVAALREMRETAIAMCPNVDTGSQKTLTAAKATAGASLPGLIKKLVDLKFGVSGEYQNTQTRGVLQDQLAQVIIANQNCRLAVLKFAQDTLSGTSAPKLTPGAPVRVTPKPEAAAAPVATSVKPPSKADHTTPATPPAPPLPKAPAVTPIVASKQGPILRVFPKNNLTNRDIVQIAKLLPAYNVQLGKSAIDPSNSADTLFVNRDRVTEAEVVQTMEALGKLGIPVKSIQQAPLGGRKEIQVGTILNEDGQMFEKTHPLSGSALSRLHGAEFWRTAFNGYVGCPAGIGFSRDCSMDENARPVSR